MTTKLLAALLLCGCASVTRGTSEPVVFESEPSGAEMHSVVDYPCGGPCPVRDDKVGSATAYEENPQTEPIPGPACVTPCTVQVARNQDLVVTFTKAGYKPKTVKLGPPPSRRAVSINPRRERRTVSLRVSIKAYQLGSTAPLNLSSTKAFTSGV